MINLRQHQKSTISYLPNTLIIPFKSLKFKAELMPYNREAVLSVEINYQTYSVIKRTGHFQHFSVELLADMLGDLEQKVLESKVVIPSKFGDYNEIINKIMNPRYYELSIS